MTGQPPPVPGVPGAVPAAAPPVAAPGVPAPAPAAPPPAAVPGVPAPTQVVPPAQPQTGMAPSSLFAGLDQADATKDGNYVRPGHYYMRLDAMKGGNSAAGKGEFMVTELTVLKVLGTSECVQAGTVAHGVGEHVTDMKMRKHQSYLNNVAAQLAGMEGMTADQLKQDLAKSGKNMEMLAGEAIGPAQPYAGRCFEITARHVPTKPKPVMNTATGQMEMQPGVFTRINYVRPVTLAEVASVMDEAEKAACFPVGTLEQAIASEQAINAALGGAPAPAAGEAVVSKGYIVPPHLTQSDENPAYGWDGQQWQPLQPAS